ncbi:hypothetical protein LXL04_015618 [Taraxacum kok-saghyz]
MMGNLFHMELGNATYRFSFTLCFYFVGLTLFDQKNLKRRYHQVVSAFVSNTWSPKCTHVVLGDNASVMSKIDFVCYKWIESLADKRIDTKIPSCGSDDSNLMLEGVCVKIRDTESRDNCLSGHTFLLESTQKYKVKEKLQALLETFGVKALPIEDFIPRSQGFEEDENNHVVHVISVDNSECTRNLTSIPNVTKLNLICATLSGPATWILLFLYRHLMATQSGKSFYNLVPFSQNPYNGRGYKGRKKRNQREVVLDDLFNKAKAKKRGASGFIQGLFNGK